MIRNSLFALAAALMTVSAFGATMAVMTVGAASNAQETRIA